MVRVPPQKMQNALTKYAPDTLCSSKVERHDLIEIPLATVH
jgi:hypothetical protein